MHNSRQLIRDAFIVYSSSVAPWEARSPRALGRRCLGEFLDLSLGCSSGLAAPAWKFFQAQMLSALWYAAEPWGFSKNIFHVLELTLSCWRRAILASLAPRDLVTLPGVVEWLEAPLDFLIDATCLCHFHPNLSNQKSALGTP